MQICAMLHANAKGAWRGKKEKGCGLTCKFQEFWSFHNLSHLSLIIGSDVPPYRGNSGRGSARQLWKEVMVHVPKIMTQTRVRHEHVEQTVEVPIPHTQELVTWLVGGLSLVFVVIKVMGWWGCLVWGLKDLSYFVQEYVVVQVELEIYHRILEHFQVMVIGP